MKVTQDVKVLGRVLGTADVPSTSVEGENADIYTFHNFVANPRSLFADLESGTLVVDYAAGTIQHGETTEDLVEYIYLLENPV